MTSRESDVARARLGAARLVGAAAIAILGQLTVDMPGGYFGATGVATRFGLIFSSGTALAAAAGAICVLRGARVARPATLLVLLSGVVFFLPAVVSDPVIAGGVMLWNLALLGLAELGPVFDRTADDDDRLADWLNRNGPAVRHIVVVAIVVATLVLGYGAGHRIGGLILCVVLDLGALVVSAPMFVQMWRGGSRAAPLIAVGLIVAAIAVLPAAGTAASLVILAAYLVLALVELVVRTPFFEELLDHFLTHPGFLVATTFVVLVAVGTMLLSLPAAAPSGQRIEPADALFTATSASCVTGLIVLDTPSDFSTFGHVVILALIQLGGLNIMVLSTFAAVILGRDLGIRGEAALGSVLDLSSPATAYRLATFIVLATLTIEAIGAAALGFAWSVHGASPAAAAWNGVFHSVSAFCNSGFALQSDSLVMFNEEPLVLVVFCVLIVLGGLGFAVLAGLWWRSRGGPNVGLGLHIKIVMVVSTALILLGWALYLGLEWNRSLAGLDPGDRIVNALFQSVTTRTAGFNSVSFDNLQPATILIVILLMFIGASPGGTGGGIKTTTAVVLLAAIPAIAARRGEVVILKRRIPLSTVFRSAAIAVVGLTIVAAAVGLLLATQEGSFESLLFEGFSAFGTVGLSLGATVSLDGLGKLVIVATMLAGRIGPLTLALMLGRPRAARVGYPQARIMVG